MKNSLKIFLASDTYAASLTSAPSETLMASVTCKALFPQILTDLNDFIPLAPKWPILVQIFTDFSTFSVAGCWGQPMLLFWKLVHETQISKPPEAARHHNSTKLLILLPFRADLLCTLHYKTPCTWLSDL